MGTVLALTFDSLDTRYEGRAGQGRAGQDRQGYKDCVESYGKLSVVNVASWKYQGITLLI